MAVVRGMAVVREMAVRVVAVVRGMVSVCRLLLVSISFRTITCEPSPRTRKSLH